jgi:hypothetical protein
MAQSQKFLVDLDLQGNQLKNVVLGTTAGTANGAIWFDAFTGLVKFIDETGTVQSVAPKSYVDSAVAGEASDRAAEITRVEGLVSAEEAARILAVNAVAADLADEVTARQNAISNLSNDLSSEATARENADTNLAADISAETTARQNADASLQDAIDAVAADLAALDTNFATDAQVTSAVAAEQLRAEGVEAQLQSDLIDTNAALEVVGSDLATEITNRQNAVSAVASDLADEVTARQAAVSGVAGDLADEVTAREAAVSAVANDLADEVSRATAAEGVIAGDLASEITNRQNAVSAVASDLADEATARQSGDFALDARVTDLEDAAPSYALSATVSADLAAEATRADAYADGVALTAENNAKAYADLIAQGLNVKEGVRTIVMNAGVGVAQPTTGTYTAYSQLVLTETGFEIDPNDPGVALAVGDHVIVMDFEGSAPAQIMTVASGAWTVREDWANDTTKAGSFVFVSEGAYAGTAWAAYDVLYGPDAPYASFQQITGVANVWSNDGSITVNGNEISVNVLGLVQNSQMTRKAIATIGNGSNLSYTITHGLTDGISAITDLVVSVKEVSTGALVQAEVVIGTGTVTVSFNEAPATDAMKVTIIG